jgi:serine/threonine protein kinase/hemoglobin-like flavoprotein/class 3 adenylate cyclase
MGLATDLELGTIIGDDYRIQRRLGEGGMGVVFAATQLTTGHQRAVKVMHSPFTVDSKARERFEQEARIGARIQSDHVVQVVAAGVEEATRTPWLAMELLEGQDLEQHIATRGPMPPLDVAFVIGQVGHALAAAHDVGVVHRDIKPENIFLSRSRVVGVPFMVKVLDFGIAKLRSSARSATVAVGTPAYMAPEQTDASDDIGPPADIWPLALVVFRMLTGEYYWRAARNDASLPLLWRELLVDPLPPASRRAGELDKADLIPPGFDEWFRRCLERVPEARYQHAREAIEALEAVFAGLGIVISSSRTERGQVLASMSVREPMPQALATTWRTSSKVQRTLRSDPNGTAQHRVSFRETGERVVTVAPEGATLLEVSLAAGIPHYHACGGRARCSTCRVVVLEGKDNLGPRTPAEQAVADRRGWPATTRLACQATVHGPCAVRRLVIDSSDASIVDIRRTANTGETKSQPATVLVMRLDGIDTVAADGFPDDTIHVFERCVGCIDELVTQNGGRLAGFEGPSVVAAFADGDDGRRRALRVALRAAARVRQLNPYLLRHFGVQVDTAAGLGTGMLVEGVASAQGQSRPVLVGSSVRAARRAVHLAGSGEVLVAPSLLTSLDVVTAPHGDDLVQVIDFAKSDVVYLVQTTFDRIGDQAPSFAQAFYDELFRTHPSAAPMFEHTDMERQRRMLTDTIGFAVRGLDDFAQVESAVRDLGLRHVDYGVSLTDYKFVGQALLGTLRRFLGEEFTPEVELAWREIYSTLVRTMVGAA